MLPLSHVTPQFETRYEHLPREHQRVFPSLLLGCFSQTLHLTSYHHRDLSGVKAISVEERQWWPSLTHQPKLMAL